MKSLLNTERLTLRPWQASDAPRLYALASDPLVGPAAGWPPHRSEEESLEIIRTVFAAPTIYAILLRQTGELIGCIGMAPDEALCADDTEMLLGYWIGTPFWGKGYCTEAAHRVLRHAFEDLKLNAVWCGNFVENIRSARIQEKCGFRFHHSETGAHWSEEERDVNITCLRREDYA